MPRALLGDAHGQAAETNTSVKAKKTTKVALWTGSRRKNSLFSSWQQGTTQLNLALRGCHSWPPTYIHTKTLKITAYQTMRTQAKHDWTLGSVHHLVKVNGCYWFPCTHSSLLSKHSKQQQNNRVVKPKESHIAVHQIGCSRDSVTTRTLTPTHKENKWTTTVVHTTPQQTGEKKRYSHLFICSVLQKEAYYWCFLGALKKIWYNQKVPECIYAATDLMNREESYTTYTEDSTIFCGCLLCLNFYTTSASRYN